MVRDLLLILFGIGCSESYTDNASSSSILFKKINEKLKILLRGSNVSKQDIYLTSRFYSR